MNTLREELNEPIAMVQRTWLRRLFVVVLGPFVLAGMLLFSVLSAFFNFFPEFWEHWVVDGWQGHQ